MSNAIDPGHYKGFSNNAQVIDISENLTSNAGQAVQYIARSCRLDGANKGDQIEDLTKAAWFINREVQRLAALEGVTAKVAEPESWATWQEVPNGVRYRSQSGTGDWLNNGGIRLATIGWKPAPELDAEMREHAPFVRATP